MDDFKEFLKVLSALVTILVVGSLFILGMVRIASQDCNDYTQTQYDKGDVPIRCEEER